MPDKSALKFFESLLSTVGPSGFEEEPAAVFRSYLEKFCDKVDTDVMGNTIGVLNPDAPFRVMLSGHYDEIGFQVVYISDDGLIYFRPNGGIDKLNVPASEVEIKTANGIVPGVIGKKPIHLLKAAQREKAVELDDMWIDIGAENREEAESMVAIGDPVALKRNVRFMGKHRVMSKALDDRIGAFVVAETMRALSKRKLNVAVYGVGSVQEELGLRGVTTSCFAINPQVGFAIDVGFATDLPDIPAKLLGNVKLGGGPVLTRSADNNVVLGRKLRETADKKQLTYQETAAHRASGGTDAAAIQLTRGGVATALISIPNRYMHSPVEICDLRDVDGAVKILTETIAALTGNEQFRPGLD
ncbi:MAG: M42 family metallopeptidase [Lentisphaerae bacterium]|nr:M42 family metallopeptidase [Lentisphaerota bacterium]